MDDEWREHIPEGEERHFERFNDLSGVLKSYAEDKSEIGRRVRPPAEDASSEDVSSFMRKHLGSPDTPDAYNLVETEDQGLKTLGENFREAAHKAALTPGQYTALQESLVQTYADLTQDPPEDPRVHWASQTQELLGDKFESVVGQAQEAVRSLLGEDEIQALVETGLTDHPHIVRMFGETIYPMIADGKVPSDKESSQVVANSKVEHIKGYREAEAEALKAQQSDPRGQTAEFKRAHEEMKRHRIALAKMGVLSVPDLDENDEIIDNNPFAL